MPIPPQTDLGSTIMRPFISMWHGVAEPRTIVPEDAGLIRRERHRGRRHGRYFHVDPIVHDAETVRQVFHRVDVGDVDGDLIALLDLELLETERRRGRRHVNTDLVAVPDHLGVGLEIDSVGLGLLDGIGKERIGTIPDRNRD